MTTREQLRRAVSGDRAESGREATTTEPTPSLPERLYAAREHKGVDLYRAERDTKIRARYLGALERGDYKELPGAVYTKGFLRNYALYLGLDPDRSTTRIRKPSSARAAPRLTAVVDLPTPPFWFAMATIRATPGSAGALGARFSPRSLPVAGPWVPFSERGDDEVAPGEGLLTAGS
jgi:hypothetical protein